MFADNPDFYPTPRAVARRMMAKITNQEAKYFLEPSAGKGDIADVIRNPCTFEEFETENPREGLDEDRRYNRRRSFDYGRENSSRVHVDVIESYPDLVSVLRGKQYDVVGFDWLTYEGVSYYDVILANPPFSEGAKHLLKMWDFLHHGEIVCLLNEETIKNPHTFERQQLAQLIADHGEVEYLGDCFSTAQRKTSVNVAMVYLRKVAVDDAPDLWAKETTPEQHHGVDYDGDVKMLAIRDNLGNMEHWFNMANEHWMKGIEHIRKAQLYMSQNKISDRHSSDRDSIKHILELALSNVHTCRAEFLRAHRRNAWTSVFEQMEFGRWLDSKQQERFMRDVERESVIPFTAENILATLENVFMSRKKLFDESVANVFDELCSHAAENGEGPEMPACIKSHWNNSGWRTNASYKVNMKLIFPNGCRYDKDFDRFSETWGDSGRIYTDLDRILCVLDGRPFDGCYTVGWALRKAFDRRYTSISDQTAESEYFEIRFYKKGTVHLKWKREDLWERFNKTAADGKKWIAAEAHQARRPHKRPDGDQADDYRCRSKGHQFVDGKCVHCKEPEVDEVEAVECEYCRAIYEHTGRIHCPIHTEGLPEPESAFVLPPESATGASETALA